MKSCKRVDKHGTIEWRNKHNQWHREDGPAIIYPTGHLRWYQFNQLHREDGPARIDSDGKVFWYLRGLQYSFGEYVNKMNWTEDQIVEYKLTNPV